MLGLWKRRLRSEGGRELEGNGGQPESGVWQGLEPGRLAWCSLLPHCQQLPTRAQAHPHWRVCYPPSSRGARSLPHPGHHSGSLTGPPLASQPGCPCPPPGFQWLCRGRSAPAGSGPAVSSPCFLTFPPRVSNRHFLKVGPPRRRPVGRIKLGVRRPLVRCGWVGYWHLSQEEEGTSFSFKSFTLLPRSIGTNTRAGIFCLYHTVGNSLA